MTPELVSSSGSERGQTDQLVNKTCMKYIYDNLLFTPEHILGQIDTWI